MKCGSRTKLGKQSGNTKQNHTREGKEDLIGSGGETDPALPLIIIYRINGAPIFMNHFYS